MGRYVAIAIGALPRFVHEAGRLMHQMGVFHRSEAGATLSVFKIALQGVEIAARAQLDKKIPHPITTRVNTLTVACATMRMCHRRQCYDKPVQTEALALRNSPQRLSAPNSGARLRPQVCGAAVILFVRGGGSCKRFKAPMPLQIGRMCSRLPPGPHAELVLRVLRRSGTRQRV